MGSATLTRASESPQAIPAGSTNLVIKCRAGGGAGGGNSTGADGSGGAGGGAEQTKTVASPATSYVFSVGAGGTPSAGNDGGDGGDTTFGSPSICTAKGGKGGKALRQQFIRLGQKQGDFVAVTSGLKEGEVIVSTGVFKLRNGQSVVIDNKLAPDFKKAPSPGNN